ncbi:hypothetical protein TPHA_0C00710 [Tetrapisispora phaffii CBS 4417]|uniref:Cation/H+ exchanger domain-containing protein n=1 Tax=Tetrapisispora phaffii (strain ATCC 24235 / CBS 4417 / NBRC 1672 / NRRL Y-8282 / UCD 70-5) TaxID=1071381 RepID=G8BR51_TETPH|nr:hypothetical protein TPHA_0C00710 [Tetrapisispora phaffii CBS 4417]CCE62227.1 hypothetical protein TPHA_0C00710 [Tetrapisispora phaffii CBS 4417]
MAVWETLEPTKPHVAYAIVGIFSILFSLVSLFIKEKLYIGESTLAAIYGLIVGPHCLKWFSPTTWGNTDSITLEITRIVLCLQIFAVAVELPRKYMLKHWRSITMLLLPVMTAGWLIIGLFIWIIIPGLNFPAGLLVSACITATDPILAQSVVSGKFAQRVPGHLRNLLSAESGCNDGMAFPFIFLSLNLILHPGEGGEIVKNWICITILYECVFGCILGTFIGYVGRRAIRFGKEKNLVDRESFLAFYIFLSFCCAGFGSTLGVDDLLVSFAAGTAFAWDGWFTDATAESKISTVIEVLLNYSYFIYFGAIIPWEQFNNGEIGTEVWRLIILAIIVLFLRRIPAVVVLTKLIPDIKTWREALFVGHFGPIGVGAIFAAILARSELESSVSDEETPLRQIPPKGTKHWQLISCVWPITCFFVVTSILVHGSSVALITLSRHLNTITLTKSFSTHTTFGGKASWMSRLPQLENSGRSFSLQRVDTDAPEKSGKMSEMSRSSTVETSGIPVRHAGGMRRLNKDQRKHKHIKKKRENFFSKHHKHFPDDELNDLGRERLQLEKEAAAGTFALGGIRNHAPPSPVKGETVESTPSEENEKSYESQIDNGDKSSHTNSYQNSSSVRDYEEKFDQDEDYQIKPIRIEGIDDQTSQSTDERVAQLSQVECKPVTAYVDEDNVIIENREGEVLDHISLARSPDDEEAIKNYHGNEQTSIYSNQNLNKLTRIVSNASSKSFGAIKTAFSPPPPDEKRNDNNKSRYYAYKVGDIVMIENADGEVLRRYRIKTKTDSSGQNENVLHKTLSKLGLKNRREAISDQNLNKEQNDIAHSEDPFTKKMRRNLTPAPKNVSISREGSLIDEDLEETSIEEPDLQNFDTQSYNGSGYEMSINGEANDHNHSSDDNDDSYSSGEESETSIQKIRRLAALGAVEDNGSNNNEK